MKSKSLSFTIVIAAWNAEKTIKTAIDSITNQLIETYEVIVVDDCSLDKTFEVVCQLAEKNQNIKILKNKKNLGPSESRNIGLKMAGGDYVGFLDADDFYSEKLFMAVTAEIWKNKSDVIKFGVREIYQDSRREVSSSAFFSNRPNEITEKAIELERLPLFGYAANSFYKTEILRKNKIFFDKNLRFAEDFFFNYSVFQKISSFSFIDLVAYNYNRVCTTSLSYQKIKNYGPLYQKKIVLLCSWANSRHCLSKSGKTLSMILVRSLYSSAIRKMKDKKYKEALQAIRQFFELREFTILQPFFKGETLSHRIAFLPLKLHSPLITCFFSYILSCLFSLYPNLSKRI